MADLYLETAREQVGATVVDQVLEQDPNTLSGLAAQQPVRLGGQPRPGAGVPQVGQRARHLTADRFVARFHVGDSQAGEQIGG